MIVTRIYCCIMLSLLFCITSISISLHAGTLKQAKYSVCFTPKDKCTQSIIKIINAAEKSIKVQAYAFTSASIAQALINAYKEGIKVFILFDRTGLTDSNSQLPDIEASAIPFLIDFEPAIAHNKIIIIDDEIVITGSFNFTEAAQNQNTENVLIIYDKTLAQTYNSNFNNRKKKSITKNAYLSKH